MPSGTWAYNVALWAWAWDQTGSAGRFAAASVGRFVPALVFSATACPAYADLEPVG